VEEEFNEINLLQPEDRPDKDLIKLGYELFKVSIFKGGKIEKIPRQIRFVFMSAKQRDGKKDSFQIILDERLSFWWFKESGKWKFDGYEAGNYERSWKEFSL